MNSAASLVSGLIAAGYLTAGLFFLRFARQADDRLFTFFAIAFWLLAVQRIALTLFTPGDNATIALYGLRAFAFIIILYAIFDKNRKSPTD